LVRTNKSEAHVGTQITLAAPKAAIATVEHLTQSRIDGQFSRRSSRCAAAGPFDQILLPAFESRRRTIEGVSIFPSAPHQPIFLRGSAVLFLEAPRREQKRVFHL